jgi:NitT/TauT family transport system permease protein
LVRLSNRAVIGHETWLRTLSVLGFLGIWQLTATLLQEPTLPTPWAVAINLYHQIVDDTLLYHLGVTLARVSAAFLLAMAIGTAIGIVMGRSDQLNAALDGVLILALNIPALVTIILCYIWFGLTDTAAVMAVAINKIPTVVVTVREGARAVDGKLLQVARVYELPPHRTLARVYLPQLYPYLMASARSGLALIWKIVLVVELLGRSNGVGFQLGTYFQFFDITSILAYTLAFAAVVMVIESVVMRPLERRLLGWRG